LGNDVNDRDRINAIQKSENDEQLDRVMNGYREEAIGVHPKLAQNNEFRKLLDSGQYMRALDEVRHAREPDEEAYFDVIRMLQFAAGRRLAIMMF
jgi:hypothetical protein